MTKTEKLLALSQAVLWHHVMYRMSREFVGRNGKLVKEYEAGAAKASALANQLAASLGIEITQGMSYPTILNPVFDQLDLEYTLSNVNEPDE